MAVIYRYEMKHFTEGKIRHVHTEDVMLGESIELESDDWPKKKNNKKRQNGNGKIVNYVVNETIYFGKGHNLATGSDVALIFDNGTCIDFRWGLPHVVSGVHKLRINYNDFPADSTVNVNIVATRKDRKTEYSAVLVNHFTRTMVF